MTRTVQIDIIEDAGSMADWLQDDDAEPRIDFAASCNRYAERLAEELERIYPMAGVNVFFSSGGARPSITGPGSDDIDPDELAQSLEQARETVAPRGNPESIIVWAESN